MINTTIIRLSFKKGLVLLSCLLFAGILFVGTGYAEKQGENNHGKQNEVLYYDQSNGVKIIKTPRDFLIKMERNQKGLYIATELGDFPEAYPEDLPPPGAHVDDASEDTDRK